MNPLQFPLFAEQKRGGGAVPLRCSPSAGGRAHPRASRGRPAHPPPFATQKGDAPSEARRRGFIHPPRCMNPLSFPLFAEQKRGGSRTAPTMFPVVRTAPTFPIGRMAPRTLPLLRQQKGDATSEARRRGFIHPIIKNHTNHTNHTTKNASASPRGRLCILPPLLRQQNGNA